MERWNGLPGKYGDPVKIGINNKINCLIIGKPTRLVTPPPPVPAPNLAAITRFHKDDSEVEVEQIYQHLHEIPVANNFCNIADGFDDQTNCFDHQHDGYYQSQPGYRSDQIDNSDSHIEYRQIAGESQANCGSRPRNHPTVDDSDDDGEQLPDEECQLREQLEVEEEEEVVQEAEEAEEVEDGGEVTDGMNGYE
jgi:hypothetical protein